MMCDRDFELVVVSLEYVVLLCKTALYVLSKAVEGVVSVQGSE